MRSPASGGLSPASGGRSPHGHVRPDRVGADMTGSPLAIPSYGRGGTGAPPSNSTAAENAGHCTRKAYSDAPPRLRRGHVDPDRAEPPAEPPAESRRRPASRHGWTRRLPRFSSTTGESPAAGRSDPVSVWSVRTDGRMIARPPSTNPTGIAADHIGAARTDPPGSAGGCRYGTMPSRSLAVVATGFIVASAVAGALNGLPERAGAVSALVGAIHRGSGILRAVRTRVSLGGLRGRALVRP